MNKQAVPRKTAKTIKVLARWVSAFTVWACAAIGHAQSTQTGADDPRAQTPQAMRERIYKLEGEVRELKAIVKQIQSGSATSAAPASETTPNGAAETDARAGQQNVVLSEDRKTLDFFRDTTINLDLDTSYAYKFNHPVGRVNLRSS
jgi:hypothetical protein